MQKRDFENIILRNSPQSILFCSYSESGTASDSIGNVQREDQAYKYQALIGIVRLLFHICDLDGRKYTCDAVM